MEGFQREDFQGKFQSLSFDKLRDWPVFMLRDWTVFLLSWSGAECVSELALVSGPVSWLWFQGQCVFL